MLPISSDIRSRLRGVKADITTLAVDAIVNAANAELLGGGGVDGAIHRGAGPELRKACRLYVEHYGRCFAGGASITEAFRLPCKYVIHAVGPVWCGGEDGETALLARAYARSFELARMRKLQTIAFPCISTGAYSFPKRQAAMVAIHVATECIAEQPWLREVIFCVYDDDNLRIYEELIAEGCKAAQS